MGEKADAHVLFSLAVANDGQHPMKMYTELDVNFLGLKMPNVGFLILVEPNSVLDRKWPNKTSRYDMLEFDMAHILGFHGKIWGENFLTPLNVWEELIHSYSISSVCIIILRFTKRIIWECQSIYHQTSNDIQFTPSKLAHLAKKKSNHNHLSFGRMD